MKKNESGDARRTPNSGPAALWSAASIAALRLFFS
jgi:hypothetical protein